MSKRKKSQTTISPKEGENNFDYGSLQSEVAQKAKESAIEIKAREKTIWSNIIAIGNRLVEVKESLPHGSFEAWVQLEFDWNPATATRYMKISQQLEPNLAYRQVLPNSVTALYQLASGLSKAYSEEEKQQMMSLVEAKTAAKGKPLTEKEIKQIMEQDLEQKIDQLKQSLQSSPHFQVDYWAKEYQLPIKIVSEIVGNFRKEQANANLFQSYQQLEQKSAQMEQLTQSQNQQWNQKEHKYKSQILELEKQNLSLTADLVELEKEREKIQLQQTQLDQQIESAVNDKVDELLQQERRALQIKLQQLAEQEKKLNSQTKKLKSSLKEVEQAKHNLQNLNDWVNTLDQFNHSLNDHVQYIVATFRKLQEVPNLNFLEDSEQEIAHQNVHQVVSEFHHNSERYSQAITDLRTALGKINRPLLKTIDVDKELV